MLVVTSSQEWLAHLVGSLAIQGWRAQIHQFSVSNSCSKKPSRKPSSSKQT